jgi:hypothetical protein
MSNQYTNSMNTFDCTYFDMSQTCSVPGCGERPAMRKTGKCAPHSVTPNDPTRADDWIDCYEGCLKHDAVARRRYLDTKRPVRKRVKTPTKRTSAGGNKYNYTELYPNGPTPLPTLARLTLLAKHPQHVRDERIKLLLRDAWRSRKLTALDIATGIHRKKEYIDNRFTRTGPRSTIVSFSDVLDIVDFLHTYEAKRKGQQK